VTVTCEQVKVKLYLGPLAGELAAELPFTLMHPKPEPDPDNERKGTEKRVSRWGSIFLYITISDHLSLAHQYLRS
jgi:hypothetical protein